VEADVKILVLISGDQLIAAVGVVGEVVNIMSPLRVIPTQENKAALFPWIMGMDFGKPIVIPAQSIITIVDPERGLLDAYLQKTSIIKTPPVNMKTTLLQEGKK
jgi:hypothetical protein